MNKGIIFKLSAVAFLSFACLGTNAYAVDSQTTMNPPGMQSSPTANKSQGEAFLLANKKNPGVITLADGLQYKVLVQGKGPQPKESDTVKVDYAGKLINGTEFDSSYKRGEPATFQVSEVIPGWVEALKLMKVGSTWELYIPANLAYGEQGAPPAIGPNETLIFKVALLEIKK